MPTRHRILEWLIPSATQFAHSSGPVRLSPPSTSHVTLPSQRWLSTHLHFNAPTIYGTEADDVIVRLVAPLVASVHKHCGMDRFFFIRYSEQGPHIRVRIRESLDGRSAATRDVIESVFRELTTFAPSSSLRVARANYEPETARYGGSYALPISERVFEASSIAAIALIERGNLSASSRLGSALLAMLAAIHVFLPSSDTARTFAAKYCGGFLPSLASWRARESKDLVESFRRGLAPQQSSLLSSIDEAWRRLEVHNYISPPIDTYVASLRELVDDLHDCFNSGQIIVAGEPARTWSVCVQWLLPSYIHMMNNRLGVSIEHEAYLAYIIKYGLGLKEPSGVQLPQQQMAF